MSMVQNEILQIPFCLFKIVMIFLGNTGFKVNIYYHCFWYQGHGRSKFMMQIERHYGSTLVIIQTVRSCIGSTGFSAGL